MSAVLKFLSDLRDRGIYIWAEGDKLHYRTTSGLLSPQDASQLQAHKKAILSILSRIATENKAALPSIIALGRDTPLVLSFAQQRLWFLSQMKGTSEAYHVPLGLRLKGELDEEALRQSLDRLVARHEPLRTLFEMVDGEGFQRIKPPETGFDLRRHDLKGQCDVEEQLSALMIEEAQAPFDLEHGPLMRGRLIRMADDDHALLITMHHINSDGWSMGIMARELSVLYGAFIRGEADPLEPLSIQYADYAAWQRRYLSGEVLVEQSAYWREALAGAPALLELPTDRERPAQQELSGGFAAIELGETLTRDLKALSQKYGMTLYMTVLAGFAVMLSRLSDQEDVVVGTPAANRTRTELEGLIGFFINTLALRIDLSGEPTVEEVLLRTRAAALGAQEHQDLPFEQVVELAKPVRSLAHTPLFQVMFDWQNNAKETFNLPGLEVLEIQVPISTAKFDMTLSLAESEGRIVGGLNYAMALFDAATAQRYAGYLHQILLRMVVDVAQPITAVDLLPLAERHKILVEWNRTEVEYPKERCIHELFESQVERSPEATAVVYEEQSLSYRELNSCANQLAHHLRSLGVGPDVLVAICVERSLQMVVGLLAILKAGGAYVPLDPTYPADRLAYMLEDSAPAVVLSYGSAHRVLEKAMAGLVAAPPTVLDLKRHAPLWAERSITNLDRVQIGLTSSHLAYVIYTSGSTGAPKGVEIEHKGVCNLAQSQIRALDIGYESRVLQFASLSFDACTYEWVNTLSAGGRLCLMSREDVMSADRLMQGLRDLKITHAVLPPTALSLLSNDDLEALSTLVVAGEACPFTLMHHWVRRRHFVNAYGPTEVTVCATLYRCQLKDKDVIPIGRPISNTRIYIVDRWCRPVPIGVPGEIYIGGAGVARGYLNRPELTAQRFIASPFVEGDRLYKTGDLGRYLPDGNIEFLGRDDFQVKIRGFRIELGEIEAGLLRHTSVREAVVLAREDQVGEKRLVAYYTGDEIDASDLRAHLSSALPDYMVPAAYVRLEMLPLTPNGKLDRKALPDPDEEAYARRVYEAPQGSVETVIAKIWSEVLGIERIGRHDNFFELGGNSLQAVRVVAKIRQSLGAAATPGILFATPILKDCASSVETLNKAALPSIIALGRDTPLVLSFAQQRLWFLSQMKGTSEAYHVPLGLRLKGELDEEALRQSLDRLVARHEPLRTLFEMVDGEGFQRIKPPETGFDLRRHDLKGQCDVEEQLSALMIEEAQAPFDLEHGPLMRGRLIRMADDDHALLITMHHINSDGWSMGIMARELSVLYGAFIRGEADPLEPLSIQYADYAAWQRRYLSGEVLVEQSAYWREALAGAPALLELPTDRERPAQQELSGGFAAIELGETLTRDLKALSQKYGMTLYMTVLAGFAVMLSRLSDQEDVVVGTPAANRTRTELEGLIGFFINTLALRIDLSGEPTVEEVLLRTRAAALGAQEHQDLPFEQVVELAKPVRSLAHTPLFQVMFDWQNNAKETFNLPGLEVLEIQVPISTAKFDMTLSLAESEGRIVGGLNYAMALFDAATAQRYAGYLHQILLRMVVDVAQPITAVDLLPLAERHKILVEWNRTEVEYPKERCIHELFESQVERSPEATAVVYEEQSLSYRELNSCANQLAHHLRSLGVGPDVLVAICVERSLQMVVGLLAILKAGGAYVPLDPTYPADRLAYMLEDSAPAVVLSYGSAHRVLEKAMAGLVAAPPTVLDLKRHAPLWAERSITNLDRVQIGLTSSHLAYVIYTSGSTGAPKGVEIEHRNTTNLLKWAQTSLPPKVFNLTLFSTSLNFDLSIYECFLPLAVGGATMVVRNILDPGHQPSSITLINTAPSAINALVNAHGIHKAVRNVNLCGDVLSQALVERIFVKSQVECIFNLYGPTETTTYSTWIEVNRATGFAPSVGRPISNTRIYIVDRWCRPVPIGVPGEIYIGGAGVARGYLNRPELTAQRFIASPFVEGDRLYKTGDLGRYLPDGNIEFLGRDDFQVKIRGFRIELGEIEAGLLRHTSVREAVVLAREDQVGEKRLVAYYTGDEIDASDLRAHLSSALPDYMVPAAYVRLEMLPLTPNGKLDRKALPDPDEEAYARRVYEAPQGSVETVIAKIWSEVLGIERIGRHDNFFELGGNSLQAVRVVSVAGEQHRLRIPLSDFIANPTIYELTRLLAPNARRAITNTAAGAPEAILLRDGKDAAAPIIYFVHPIAGGVASYVELCNYLQDSTIVGLEPPNDLAKYGEQNLIQDLSAGYAEVIQKQSTGQPVVLCGWSLGANLAFGIANELHNMQQPPHALVLIDPSYLSRDTDCKHADSRARSDAEVWREYELTVIGAKAASRLHSDPRYDTAKSGTKLEMFRSLYKEYLPSLSVHFDDAINDFKFFRLVYRSNVFNSFSQFSGKTCIILSRSASPPPSEAIVKWQALSSGPIELHQIDAGHVALVLNPQFAKQVAEKISGYIVEASQNEHSREISA